MADDVISEMKKKTADALEEAAKKLRESEEPMSGEEIWDIVHDVEGKLQEVVPKKIEKAEEVAEEMGEDLKKKLHEAEKKLRSYAKGEHADIEKKVRSVESFVSENPIPAVAIAAGAGLLFGLIAARLRD